MASSRALLVPGLRTLPRGGWRSEVGTAATVVLGQPHLWLLGAVGFALRGGIVLLTLPILVLPTQVEVRLLLGNNLGSTGFSAGFWGLVVAAGVIAGVLTLGIVLALANVEVSAFERLVDDPETADQRQWRTAPRLSQEQRRMLILRVASVQALTLMALTAAAIPLILGITSAAYDEIVRPSSADSIYLRVLADVRDTVLWFGVAVVLVEMISSRTTRALLVRGTGLSVAFRTRRLWLLPALGSAIARIVRSPIRALVAEVLAWTVSIAVLVPVLWAISICWEAVRGVFLTSLSFGDLEQDVGLVFVALALSGVFISGLLLCGFASALRAALRSVEALR